MPTIYKVKEKPRLKWETSASYGKLGNLSATVLTPEVYDAKINRPATKLY
jgi:hypothetical protein